LTRKKGLYSSHISKWRRQREEGILGGLTDKKRGRKANPDTASKRQVAALEKQNAALQKKLKQAEMMIDIQKKVSEMFGMRSELLNGFLPAQREDHPI